MICDYISKVDNIYPEFWNQNWPSLVLKAHSNIVDLKTQSLRNLVPVKFWFSAVSLVVSSEYHHFRVLPVVAVVLDQYDQSALSV